jgi:branched-chain amino acid transport system substrate-binding protein
VARPHRLFLLVLALVVAGDDRQPARAAAEQAGPVIGLLLPPEEPEAAGLRDGVALAVEHANQGAVGKVSLVIRGRLGQWGADAVEAARMVLDDGAQGLIAPPSGAATHLALQVSGRTAVPVASLCPDSSVTRAGIPWMLRVAPGTIEEARTVFSGLGLPATNRWVAFVPDGRAGREVLKDLAQAAIAVSSKLEKTWETTSPLTNIETLVAQVVTNRPEGILLWLDPVPAGTLARRLRKAGYQGKLAGPSRCQSPAFAAAAAGSLEGFLIAGMVLDPQSAGRLVSFRKAFRERFGREGDLTSAQSYDAATLLIELLRRAPAANLPKAFPLAFSLPGVTGELSFDSYGNRKVALQLLAGHEGHFDPVKAGGQNPQTLKQLEQ